MGEEAYGRARILPHRLDRVGGAASSTPAPGPTGSDRAPPPTPPTRPFRGPCTRLSGCRALPERAAPDPPPPPPPPALSRALAPASRGAEPCRNEQTEPDAHEMLVVPHRVPDIALGPRGPGHLARRRRSPGRGAGDHGRLQPG